MEIAVLLTSYNRKEKTHKALDGLLKIQGEYQFHIFLTVDGSTDGTFEMVSKDFPNVILLKGNGSLFWNRGMHLAWQEAAKQHFDFYIWLNDDVILYTEALMELMACSKNFGHKSIISGIVENHDQTMAIYGGYDTKKKIIQSNGEMNPIRFLNGNVVLVPQFVFSKLGNLDPVFHHDFGDGDYGLRAQAIGIGVYSTRTPVAAGEKNPICRVRLDEASLFKRFRQLYSPLGSHPFINFYYRKRHFGWLNASIYFIFLHFLNILPDSLNRLLFGKKYV